MVPIIYEDQTILVVNKPAHLVVEPSQTQKGKQTLVDYLASYLGETARLTRNERMGLVHRLDQDTSGVLLVAKTLSALTALQEQFRLRKTKKEYLALVHGEVKENGTIDTLIGRHRGNRKKFVAGEGEREAVTAYTLTSHWSLTIDPFLSQLGHLTRHQQAYLTKYAANYTLLSVFPQTGRTHQIRVHLKYMGYPVVSDSLYAPRKLLKLDLLWCPRQFLHAESLGFFHPQTGEWMTYTAPLPDDLSEALLCLREES